MFCSNGCSLLRALVSSRHPACCIKPSYCAQRCWIRWRALRSRVPSVRFLLVYIYPHISLSRATVTSMSSAQHWSSNGLAGTFGPFTATIPAGKSGECSFRSCKYALGFIRTSHEYLDDYSSVSLLSISFADNLSTSDSERSFFRFLLFCTSFRQRAQFECSDRRFPGRIRSARGREQSVAPRGQSSLAHHQSFGRQRNLRSALCLLCFVR